MQISKSHERMLKNFYKRYPVDHWLYKLNYLKNSIDNFDQIKDLIYKDLKDTKDDDCLLMFKTEIHFTYFQIVETLFELIFAFIKDNDLFLWLNLSITNRRKINKHLAIIKKIADKDFSDINITKVVPSTKENTKIEIPFLQYVFFFGQALIPELTVEEIKLNLVKIKESLTIFAKDFSDRNEYNAFKHTHRLYHSKNVLKIAPTGTNDFKNFGETENAFNFIERVKGKIQLTTKSFDPDRDYELSLLANNMLSNIIVLRKQYYHNIQAAFYTFHNLDLNDISKMKSSLHKFSLSL
jgi:hypothetical protein